VVPAAPGLLSPWLSVAGDDFGPNDRRHRIVVVRPRLDVLLLDGDLEEGRAPPPSEGALIALALDPPGDGSLAGIRVTRVWPSAPTCRIAAADVLLVHDAPDFTSTAAAVLARHREGRALVVAGERCAKRGQAVPTRSKTRCPGACRLRLPGRLATRSLRSRRRRTPRS
jgi:hypothetical protein